MIPPLDLRPSQDRETCLLIECARASVDTAAADRIRALASAGLDWDRLLTLAGRHGLKPLLYWHLNRLGAPGIPGPTLASLREYFQTNSAFSLLLTGELLRLLAALRERGVEAVPFKGSAIAVKLYGHVALRQFCDLDILVRQRDVWRASAVIEARGFAPQFTIPDDRRAAFVRQDYVQLFQRDAGRTLVELHWGIARRSYAVRFDTDALWPRLEPMTLQGTTVLMPRAEDLLLMLCVHGSRHGWDKLENLCALAEIVRGRERVDWTHVWQKAGEMHCRRMVGFGLLLAHGLLDLPLPADVMPHIQSGTLVSMARGVVRDLQADAVEPHSGAHQAVFQLRLKDSYADLARSCARVVLTPTPDDWAAVRLHGPLSLAYPLVRAVRVARKHGFNHQHTAGV